MALSQIEEYRIAFDKMTTSNKKAFIDRLSGQLRGKSNPEYTKLLNECVQKYNVATRSGISPTSSFDGLIDRPFTVNSIAEPSQRLIAYFIDLLLASPMYVLSFLANLFYDLRAGYLPKYSSYTANGIEMPFNYVGVPERARLFLILALSALILFFAYSIFCLFIQIGNWKKGTSFGKKAMKLYVVNKETGKAISTGNMFLREVFGKLISGMIFSLGFIWILIDKDKQGWHDKLVSSIVVKK